MFSISMVLDKKLHAHNSGSWRGKSSAVKDARLEAGYKAKAAGEPVAGKAVVDYLFCVPNLRPRDAANMIQSCKPLIDGVVDAGMIEGDHWQALEIGTVRVTHAASKGDVVSVSLTFRKA